MRTTPISAQSHSERTMSPTGLFKAMLKMAANRNHHMLNVRVLMHQSINQSIKSNLYSAIIMLCYTTTGGKLMW